VATAAARTRTPAARGRVRIAAEPLEVYIEGYVIDQWRNRRARKIAQSDDDRMEHIGKITSEMAQLQQQKNEALRMKLRGEVDAKTFREVPAKGVPPPSGIRVSHDLILAAVFAADVTWSDLGRLFEPWPSVPSPHENL
jgi:hypothetical protein